MAQSSVRITMRYLVKALVKYGASDMHLKSGRPPLYRVNGKLIPAKMPEFSSELVKDVVWDVLPPCLISEFESRRQTDFSFVMRDLGRFRCNLYFQQGQISAAIRLIPFEAPDLETLGLPAMVTELALKTKGLLLVTGATGCGKSTTLAGMIEHINRNCHVHILTIENPIEFVYSDKKALISQREVGSDVTDINQAIYAAMRQDPDIIVIGELRDYKTIQAALTAAETGHLVMSTLHTNDAKSTIDRIIDVFPSESKNQVRIQLASTLLAVVAQQLVLRADKKSRVPACEILVRSPAVEDCIRQNELSRIIDLMAASNDYYHMQTMNMSLERLVSLEIITQEEALAASDSPDDLKLKFSGMVREP